MTNPTPDQVNERLAKFDGTRTPIHNLKGDKYQRKPIDYMHSPADALRVAEKMGEPFSLQHVTPDWWAAFGLDLGTAADTPAAAIALAVYRALEEEVLKDG